MQGFDPSAQGTFAATGRALKARLGEFFPPGKFTIELMPAAITKTVWRMLAQRTPFIGIAFRDVVVPEAAGVNPTVEQRWQVHLVVQAGTAEQRLLGDARSPGLVNMLAVALLGLHAWPIDDVGTVFCGTASSLGGDFLNDDQGIIGIPLTIPTGLVADEAVADFATLQAIDITWNFDPALPVPQPDPPPPARQVGFAGTDTIDLTPET